MTTNDYRAKCQNLADFYAEAARTGRDIQFSTVTPKVWFTMAEGPNVASKLTDWRLKPEPQKFWIVWEPSGFPCVFAGEEIANGHAKLSGGTVQEIERPEE